MKEKKLWTYEDFVAAIKLSREESEKRCAEIEKMQKENAKELAEMREQQKENAKLQEETAKKLDKLGEYVYAVNTSVEGMKKSSGDVAEEYFFNSLEKTKTLGGVHFDSVERNWKSSISLENGKTLDGEYDIVLINKDSMGIVEVKFKVSRKDVENLAKKQVESFKRIFPNYSKYKFYLGIGSMSFNKQAEDEAKKLGVGIFKLNGDAVEIYDKNLKVY
ncbi:MAG: hypothetical protein FWF51_00590 [Chitinivibrionia bacterium]|nr:hypothetical protein [Chitinivibrionia bacterium]